MSSASYQPPGGRWPAYEPVAPVTGTRRPSPRVLLPAILLIVAGALAISSTFLTIAESTHRLLSPNSNFGDDLDSKVNVTTTTAWSTTFSAAGGHTGQPFDGWGLVLAGAIALVVAVLLIAGRRRWSWTTPAAALASGLLAGVVLMSLLRFAELMSWDFHDNGDPRRSRRRGNRGCGAPDGRWLASVGGDMTIRVWEKATGRALTAMRVDGALYSCAWTPHGSGLVVGGRRGLYFFDFCPGADGA